MGNPAYIFSNLAEGATLSSSTADASYPLANMKDRILAKPFKFTQNGGWVELDLTTTRNFDSVALLNHNMPDLVSGTLKAGAAPNPSSVEATLVHRPYNLWSAAGTTGSVPSVNARYVRVEIAATGNPTSYGELVLGKRCELPRPPRWGIPFGRISTGATHRTYGGVTWDYEFNEYQYLRPTFRFPQSEYYQFELFHRSVLRNPFVWIPDIDKPDVYYVKKRRGFEPVPIGPARDSRELVFNGGGEEISLGAQAFGWTSNSGAGALIAEDQRYAGRASIKVASVAQDSYSSQRIRLIAGTTYELSGWIKLDSHAAQAGRYAQLALDTTTAITVIEKLNSSGDGPTSADIGLALDGTADDWTLVRATFIANATEYATLYVGVGYFGTATATAWFDQISLKEIGVLDHWYDWPLDLEAESVGLTVSS